MATTRRLSGLNAAGTTVANPTYEAYDNFKKKHLAQNKEIIHRNSELNKTNAELNRTITLLRAERLSLKGSHFQLECENASLRTKLDRAEARERELLAQVEGRTSAQWGGLNAEQIDTMRRSLASAIAALQACGMILPPSAFESQSPPAAGANLSPATPTPPTVASSTSTPVSASASTSASTSTSTSSTNNVSVSRRRSLAARAGGGRQSMTAMPDLSYISEGGEGSTELAVVEDDGWNGPVLEGLREEPPAPPISTRPMHHPISPSIAKPSLPPAPPSRHSSPPSAPRSPGTLTAKAQQTKAAAAASKPIRTSRPPPAAPSSTSNHDSSAEAQRRPARRASGLVRPPRGGVSSSPPVAIQDEEDEQEEQQQRCHDDDENGDVDYEDGQGKKKRRKSAEEDKIREQRKPLSSVEANVETFLKPTIEKDASQSRHRRTVSRALSTSSEDEGDDATDDDDDDDGDDTEENKLAQDARVAERLSAARTAAASNVVDAAKKKQRAQTSSVLGAKAAAAAVVEMETVTGGSRGRIVRKVEELDAVREEERVGSRLSSTSHSEAPPPPPPEEDAANAGGRRARKSVNYALPKLNSKMRRPEDYVPVTHHLAHTGPRKSVKPSTSSSSVGAPSAPRRSILSSAARTSEAGSEGHGADDHGDAVGEEDDEFWVERPRPVSGLGSGSGSGSLLPSDLVQSLEQRRRERERKEALLVKKGVASGSGERRRHSTAV